MNDNEEDDIAPWRKIGDVLPDCLTGAAWRPTFSPRFHAFRTACAILHESDVSRPTAKRSETRI
jgi:hypothetical protein